MSTGKPECNVLSNNIQYYDASGVDGLAQQASGSAGMASNFSSFVSLCICATLAMAINGLQNAMTIILCISTLCALVAVGYNYLKVKAVSDKWSTDCTTNPRLGSNLPK